MKPNTKLTILAFIIITLAILIIRTGINDPFYKTNKTISTTVINKYYASGKMGGSFGILLKLKDGKTFSTQANPNKNYKVGDEVILYIYERKISGVQKYELK